tara:strand:+ start:690 stop:1250 length:561 start_codon:yes stop_codon:yes gene_type:complete
MSVVLISPKPIVAAIMTLVLFTSPVKGEDTAVADLLERLQQADTVEATKLSRELQLEWSKSGSASMNLLLKRGKEALERGEFDAAADHLTALTDHAPQFAEGWALRAQLWHHMDRPGLALSDLQQVLVLNPNHYESLFGLAVTLEQLEEHELALEAYRLVLTIHPHYEEATEAVERLAPQVQGQSL